MNNDKRKKLEAAQKRLDNLRGDVGTVLAVIQDVFNEVEETYENMSESAQSGERGQKLEASKDALQEAIDCLEEMDDKFGDADSNLTTAME